MSASHSTASRAPGATGLGVALPYWLDRDPGEAISVARAADELRYDELWIGEMATFDAFALAGAIARETDRIRLVVGPLPVVLRDPVALAMGSSSVTELGGRPSDLLVGASSPTVLSDWHGVDRPPSLQSFRDVIDVLRRIFDGRRTDDDLDTVRSSGFRLRVSTGSPVALGVAAFGPRMVELAAEIADRVVIAHVTPAQTAAVRERLDRRAAEVGRETAPRLTVWMAVALNEQQIEQVMRGLVAYVGQRGYRTMFEDAGFGELVELARSGAGPKQVLQAMPHELVATVAGIGSVADALERIGELHASGADQVCVVPATAGDDTGAAVLTALSDAASGGLS